MRMRNLAAAGLLLLAAVLAPLAAEIPSPQGYVNDFAGVIKPADEQRITAVSRSVENNGGIQLAVVTVESMEGQGIEMYANELANSWGIGSSDGDLGLLLLLAVEERQVRIEVGYGLEGDITDGLSGRILDTYVLPAFREGDFSGGLTEGMLSLAATLAERRDFTLDTEQRAEEYAVSEDEPGEIIGIIISFFIFIFIFGRLRMWPLLLLMGGRRSHLFGGGGFGSSAGRGGGFGGFGGGGFGGGGASRGF